MLWWHFKVEEKSLKASGEEKTANLCKNKNEQHWLLKDMKQYYQAPKEKKNWIIFPQGVNVRGENKDIFSYAKTQKIFTPNAAFKQ